MTRRVSTTSHGLTLTIALDRHSPHHSSPVNVPGSASRCGSSPTGLRLARTRIILFRDRNCQEQETVKGLVLAAAYCPTQLPAQYRRRWGVSRPCSGRERVGPPRAGHQDQALDRLVVAESRADP